MPFAGGVNQAQKRPGTEASGFAGRVHAGVDPGAGSEIQPAAVDQRAARAWLVPGRVVGGVVPHQYPPETMAVAEPAEAALYQ